jgi:hypothetical protein
MRLKRGRSRRALFLFADFFSTGRDGEGYSSDVLSPIATFNTSLLKVLDDSDDLVFQPPPRKHVQVTA